MVDINFPLGHNPPTNAVGDGELDLSFYRTFYPDLAKLGDDAAVLHWNHYGKSEGRYPNASAFNSLPTDFDPIRYLFLNRDLGAEYQNATAAMRHYLDSGMSEGRPYSPCVGDLKFQAAYRRRWPPPGQLDSRMQWLPLDAAHYLYLHGLTDCSFLSNFDHEFYAAVVVGCGIHLLDRNDCILHFAEEGIQQLLPIAQDLQFDADFHRRRLNSENSLLSKRDDADLYRNWLVQHDFQVNPPNHAMQMKRLFGVACCGKEVIDLDVHRIANKDLQFLDDEELIEHLFRLGLFEPRTSVKISRSNAPIFAQYASQLEASGEIEKAEFVYDRLSHFQPDQPWLTHRFADFLFRRNRMAAAYRFYRRNIEADAGSKWDYINAASACQNLGDFVGCVETLDTGCRNYPGDQNMRRNRQAAAERCFVEQFGYARTLAETGKVKAAQTMAYEAAARCDFASESAAPERPVQTVAIFANMDLPQCTLYRVEQKSEQLASAGYAVRVYDWSHDQVAFRDELADLDAVIFYRVVAFPSVVQAINAARAAGLFILYDIDDLVFDAEDYPEPFAGYAGLITPAQYVDLCMGVPLFRYALQLCDFAIASTPTLARRMEPLVRRRRAFVHRNALGLRHEIAMEAQARERTAKTHTVMIFYGSGTKAHKLDFERILLPALRKIDSRFGDQVCFLIAGHRPAHLEGLQLSRVRFEPFTNDVEGYWAALSRADIALSVLRREPATNAKSEIKWLEAAMFAIPSVVSATNTFEEVVEDGVDGFLATDAEEFEEKISLLIADPARRLAMGQAARAKALREYSMATLSANLREMFESIAAPQSGARTRVLVVNVFYAPQAHGGATRVVLDNIRDMRALYPNEFEFEVFTTLEGGLRPYSVEVSSHDGVRTTAMVAGDYGEVDFTANDVRAGDVFARCVERFAPHLIHFHCIQRISASATEVARKMSIPYLITAHDGWWISDRQFLFDDEGPAPRYEFNKPTRFQSGPRVRNSRPNKLVLSLKGAAAVLAVSHQFAAIYRGTGLENVRSVPNGLPPIGLGIARTERVRDTASSRPKVCLGHIGGLERHKGFHLLKYAIIAAKPRNITVLVVDNAFEAGEERMEFWGETRVSFIARRPLEKVAALYADIDVLFALSMWEESFGLVTREALTAGCWVVASDRGSIGEPIREGVNGHVVSVDDLSGLVAVLNRIDADPAHYLVPAPPGPPMRTSVDQARDLATIYREEIARARNGGDPTVISPPLSV